MIKTLEKNRIVDCFANQTYEVPEILKILDSETVTDPENGCFRVMSQKDGDKRVVWSRKVIAEIKAAKQMFLDLISKGMTPYKVGVDGAATSEVMKEFDPIAEEIIFIPVRALAGG